MWVRLKDLKPNAWRRIGIDPIIPEVVANLAQSIKIHGFWGGIVVRRVPAGLEVVAGHHRVLGAIKAGVTHADITAVRDTMTDAEAVLIYARENNTQRSNDFLAAGTGSVAAATWLLARSIMRGEICQIVETCSAKAEETLRGQICSAKGLGEKVLEGFLGETGIETRSIRDYLANVKACGEYAKIIAEVCREIKAEVKDEKLVAAAHKAAAAVRGHVSTFDLAGVAEHFNNHSQVRAFREIVTAPKTLAILPVEKQAALAEALVAEAEKNSKELTANFIQAKIGDQILEFLGHVRSEEKESFKAADAATKLRRAEQGFCRHVGSIMVAGAEILELIEENPDLSFNFSKELRSNASLALKIIQGLNEAIKGRDNITPKSRWLSPSKKGAA